MWRDNPFLVHNMFYNAGEDYYVCPMGQHLEHIGDLRTKSDLGYVSTASRYRARNCSGCPLRGMCYKGHQDRRTIEVNYRNNAFRAEAKRLLTGERGLFHRSKRPIEPEAVFGDIKFNHGFRRFRLKSNEKVKVGFGLVTLAHNLRKYMAQRACKADRMGLRRASLAFQRTLALILCFGLSRKWHADGLRTDYGIDGADYL